MRRRPVIRLDSTGPGRLLPLVVAVLALLLSACGAGDPAPSAQCQAALPGRVPVTLSPEQAANAATIAATGRRLGLPDHAVTVALVTALQESKLRNLGYGDRDSLGLFQQRPSQGWGSPADIQTPRLAAAEFFRHLRKVPGWESLPVAAAAQAVQHSAAPDAYAQWESQARVLAQVLTGEVPAGLTCVHLPQPGALQQRALLAAGSAENGAAWLPPASPRAAWASAAWIVAHSQAFSVHHVDAVGRRWQVGLGRWQEVAGAGTFTFD